MILLALLVLLADGVISVPASHWSAVDVRVAKAGSVVDTTFSVPSGATGVEAILVTRRDAERFNSGRSYQPICRSGYQTEGRFRCEVMQSGDYILLLDNRMEGRKPAEVTVKIHVREPDSVIAITVPPAKRALIIALSMLFFVAVVMYSARQFMR